MTVNSAARYKGSTWEVFIDGNRIYLHKEIVADYGLRPGAEISPERYEEMMLASDRRRATERALYLLDYRDYSYSELFKKLNENYDEDTCYYVLNKLVSLGLINDRRYAENLARKYMEVQKYGYYRASNEMYRKGLDRDLVAEVLSTYDEGTAERICEIIRQKYSGYLDDPDKVRRMKNALARRGYSFSDINEAVRMMECADYDEYE
ncbi:MAG: recombination regulator RecX [Oscillospiraceae bacterium]|nr:recombination regulator RecX [Oscillospiraceae bacterium]